MFEIKAVLMDADGVLVDSLQHSLGCYPRVAKELGFEAPPELVRKLWGMKWDEYLQALWPGIDLDEFEEVYHEMGFDKDIIPQIKEASSVLVLLKEGGYFLALISSRERESLERRFREAGIDLDIFDLVQGVENCPYHKPDSRVFNPVLWKTYKRGIEKNEAVYVGDTLDDYKAAREAGIKFIGVLTGGGREEDFIEAGLRKDCILESIKGVLGWLGRQ